MTELLAETLAEQLARRIAERDSPPPPPPLSQEPAAVQARLEAWLLARHRQRDPRGRHRQARMLLALIATPQCSSAVLAQAAGQQQRAAARTLAHLCKQGLTSWQYRGRVRYHWLTPATEDALLLVVAGPPATP